MSMDKHYTNLWTHKGALGAPPRYHFSRIYLSTEVQEMIEGRSISPDLGWSLVGSFVIEDLSITQLDQKALEEISSVAPVADDESIG